MYNVLCTCNVAVGSFIVGSIRAQQDEFSETKGMSGLYYLGSVCVNGTLQSIRAAGPISNTTAPTDESIKGGIFALFVVRNDKVYQIFRVQRNLTDDNSLRGTSERKIDVKESDDILVFIYKTCESRTNGFVCPWQVNFPAPNTSTSYYYNGSDDINTSAFNAEVNGRIAQGNIVSTDFSLNVEVIITGKNHKLRMYVVTYLVTSRQ